MACEIILDNYNGRYSPGDVIAGKIVFEFDTSEQVELIEMYLKGEEHTEWSVNETLQDSQGIYPNESYINEEFSGTKIFFSAQYILAETWIFEPGRYEYPFSETLPLTVPGSYQGPFGSVEFSIEVISAYAQNVDKNHKSINVVAPVDVRDYPLEEWNPCTHNDERDISGDNCCGIEGPATMTVQLDRSVFLTGQTILVHVELHNGSQDDISRVNLELIKVLSQTATYPQRKIKTSVERIAEKTCSGATSYRNNSYDVPLNISETLMVYNFNLCSLFSQMFLLRVHAIFSENNGKMEVEIPIRIGNIDSGPDSAHPLSSNDFAIGFVVPGGGAYPPPRSRIPPSVPIPSAPSEGHTDTPEYTPPPSYNDAMKNSVFPPISNDNQ